METSVGIPKRLPTKCSCNLKDEQEVKVKLKGGIHPTSKLPSCQHVTFSTRDLLQNHPDVERSVPK